MLYYLTKSLNNAALLSILILNKNFIKVPDR